LPQHNLSTTLEERLGALTQSFENFRLASGVPQHNGIARRSFHPAINGPKP